MGPIGNYKMLAYFAQGDTNSAYLAHVENERNKMKGICEGSIQYLPRDSAESTAEKIGKDLVDYRNEIVIFHYSGHANGDKIFLQGGSAEASALANLLGQCPNLRLVVLNGCSTQNQVIALYKNKVKAIIATSYSIADYSAYVFAVNFYQTLFSKPNFETIRGAFSEAVRLFALQDGERKLMPQKFKEAGQPILAESIPSADRGGMEMKATDTPSWGLFRQEANERFVSGVWMPGIRVKNEMARAFTCGRNPISIKFGIHLNEHNKSKKVLHYFLVDHYKKSLLGVSIKSLYENITKYYSDQEPRQCLYPCDPNLEGFRDKVIWLDRRQQNKEQIIVQIWKELPGKHEIEPQKFSELFEIPDIKNNKDVFIIVKVEEDEFESMRESIIDLIDESLQIPAIPSENRHFLFFWFIETKESLWPWKGSLRKSLAADLSHRFNGFVTFLHENMKPIPIPRDQELEKWKGLYGIIKDKDKEMTELSSQFKKDSDVIKLENGLKVLIMEKN